MTAQDDNKDPKSGYQPPQDPTPTQQDPDPVPVRPSGPWTDRVTFSQNSTYAFRPRQILVTTDRSQAAAIDFLAGLTGTPPTVQPVSSDEWLLTVPESVDLDVEFVVAELRHWGVDVEPNYVVFSHSDGRGHGCGQCHACCGGGGGAGANPVYANPVYANPVYANPVYANPVYANPVYANPVYANPVYANPVYANPVYANPVYANPVYANDYRASGIRSNSATPAEDPAFSVTTLPDGEQRAFVLDTGIAAPDELPALLNPTGLDTTPVIDRDQPDENNDGQLDPAAGHGTFIASILEMLAPGRALTVAGVLTTQGEGDIAAIATRLHEMIGRREINDQSIINLSFGGYAEQEMRVLARAIRHVQLTGAVVVASAGNDGVCRPLYPACLPGVVSVGSIEPTGRAPYSNFGPWVRACAHGTRVVSGFFKDFDGSTPAGPPPDDTDPDHFQAWAAWTGTSFAAPIVAASLLRHMALTGHNAKEAVAAIIDAPNLFRYPGLGTVINTPAPTA